LIGQSIAHYEVTGKLGEGAMGEVYRATDSKLNRGVAIKLLSSRFSEDAALVARLKREAEILASLSHAHIGQIYGLEQAGDSLALVLELVPTGWRAVRCPSRRRCASRTRSRPRSSPRTSAASSTATSSRTTSSSPAAETRRCSTSGWPRASSSTQPGPR
jgi:hypothetical protein